MIALRPGYYATNVAALMGGFSPLSLSPALWLRADQGLYQERTGASATTAASADADPVGTWLDQSGNGRHATAAADSKRPTLKLAIVNGKPVVRFDGSDDFLDFGELTTVRSACFVVKHADGSQDSVPLLGHPTLFHWHGNEGFADTDKLFSGSTSASIRNGAAYQDGVSQTPINMVLPATFRILSFVATASTTVQYITNDRNAAARVWQGDYAEIALFDYALSDTQRGQFEQYAAARYGITL
jgi:hypothetical protein